MKKLISVLVAFIVILAGCGNSSSAVKVTLVQNKGEIQTGMTELAQLYNEAQDKYEVEVLPVANDPGAMQAQIASSEAPTIFTTNGFAQIQQYKEFMAEIPTDDQLVGNALTGSTAMLEDGDKLYGLPAWIEGFSYIVNEDILAEAGVTKEDLATAKGLDAACKKIEDKGYQCINVPDEPYFIGGQPLNPALAQTEYETFIADVQSGKQKIEDNEYFQSWMEFMDVQKSHAGTVIGTTYDDSTNAFATGKAAIIYNGNWVESILTTYDLSFKYSFVPMGVSGNDKISSYVAVNWHINNKKSAEEQAGALDFLNWMYSDEASKTKIATEFGVVAPYQGFDTSLYGPLSAEVFEYYDAAKGLPLAISYLPEGYIDNDLNAIAEKYYDGQLTGEEYLAEITKSLATEGK